MLLAFILGPLMEEFLRRAMLLSRGDPLVFIQRPISATLLAIAVLAMCAVLLPTFGKDKGSGVQRMTLQALGPALTDSVTHRSTPQDRNPHPIPRCGFLYLLHHETVKETGGKR